MGNGPGPRLTDAGAGADTETETGRVTLAAPFSSSSEGEKL